MYAEAKNAKYNNKQIMDNQQPAQPVPQPTPPQPAAPKPAAPQAAPASVPAPVAKPGMPLPKDQTKSNRKMLLGCVTAFGCSLLLFIGVLFAFLGFGDTANPIFGFLGVPSSEVVNFLITLINFIFLFLVFVCFILVVVGIFRISATKKEDKDGKRKATTFTFIALALLVMFVFLWILAYFFLAPKRTATVVKMPIITTPANTINMTAPVTVKFDASAAPINKNSFSILSYGWDFGDGAKASGAVQTHTFTSLGNYKVQLLVTVKELATGKEQTVPFTRDVTIQNVLASVVIKADKTTGGIPLTVNLDGADSSSPNGEITGYSWDLNGDGLYDNGTEKTAKVTFDKTGTYKIGLRVTDSTGTFATNSIDIEVTMPDNPVPVITIEGVQDTDLEANKSYMFSAAGSTAVSGTIEKYSWAFGDGQSAATRTATHSFKEVGQYDVVLKITDSSKKEGETTVRFTVKAPDAAPLAAIKTTPEAVNGTIKGSAPFEVIFDASGSQDPNNNIIQYDWDFDGDAKTDASNITSTYKFQTPGTYNTSLTVTDTTNLTTKAQITVKVEAAGLKANIKADPIAGVAPLTVSFDASGSSYPSGTIVAYEWDFGDGTAPKTDIAKIAHQYSAIGMFTAKVTAISSDNKRAPAQISINVRSVPLKACFSSSPETGVAPLEVQFDPTCSTGGVQKYTWNFAGLGTSSERKPKFTFPNAGEFEITLETADATGGIDIIKKKITIQPKQ